MSTTTTTKCDQCQEVIGTGAGVDDEGKVNGNYNVERIHMNTLTLTNRDETFPTIKNIDFCSAQCCAKYVFHYMDTGTDDVGKSR